MPQKIRPARCVTIGGPLLAAKILGSGRWKTAFKTRNTS
jgi:hypothetical protein